MGKSCCAASHALLAQHQSCFKPWHPRTRGSPKTRPRKLPYSVHQVMDYPSSLPGMFPDIKNCQCIVNIFGLP
jgi:hypothetical protein